MHDTYARAERFLEWHVGRLMRNVALQPRWTLDSGDRFWVDLEEDGGKRRYLVDPDKASMAADEGADVDDAAPDRLRSPDGKLELFHRDGELCVARRGSDDCRSLGRGLAESPDSSLVSVTTKRTGQPQRPVAMWSPDSTRIVTHRLDQEKVGSFHLVQSVPPDGQMRPQLFSFRVAIPGDAHVATAALVIIDVDTGSMVEAACDPLLVQFLSPMEIGWVWWGGSGAVYALRESRCARSLALLRIDAGSGETRTILEESSDDYVEPSTLLPWKNFTQVVNGQVVWLSERDGWWHLYLFDESDGTLIRRLTSGSWLVREILRADEEFVYFVGCGREAGRDPYERHFYRVRMSGGEVELLTPEDGDHSVVFTPSGKYFLDTFSRVDTAPLHRLRRADGSLVMDVATADLTKLRDTGWRPPEPFRVECDGDEVYGLLYFPTDFDAARKYPVIDSIYPGPQLIRTPKAFAIDSGTSVIPYHWPGIWVAQALAELGFVVVNVDGRGTPLRSAAFHRRSSRDLQDASLLDDHISALRQLAETRPYLDLERVGITGHSGGGFASTRAMLERPDFFKVAVSASGNHDNRRYLAYWGEKYQGPYDPDLYAGCSNVELAERLQGRLLLMHGDMDDNVHPCNTIALVDALVKANKDFDLVILPNEPHACYNHPYYVRRMWDFFVRHLMGAAPPVGYRIQGPGDVG